MKLYEIAKEYEAALEAIEVDILTGELIGMEAVEAMETALDDKLEAAALHIKNLNAMADAINEEEGALYERRKTLERRIEGFKMYVARCMDAVEKKKLETPRVVLSIRSSTRVEIDNERVLPREYIKPVNKTTIDKTAIRKALEAGQPVAGARLETRRNLQIK